MLPLSALLSDQALASLPPAEIERGVFMALLQTRLMSPGAAHPQVVSDWFESQVVSVPPVLDRLATTGELFPGAAAAWRRLGFAALADALAALPSAPDALRPALAATADAQLATLADFHFALLREHIDAFRSVPDVDGATLPSFMRPPADRPDALALLADDDASSELEDATWLAVCARTSSTLPDDPVVRDWFITRLVLWEALNGGAAQVAVNVGELLDEAVAAWRRAGQDAAADAYQQIADARAQLPEGADYDDAVAALGHLDDPLFEIANDLESLHGDWIRRERAAFTRFLGG